MKEKEDLSKVLRIVEVKKMGSAEL